MASKHFFWISWVNTIVIESFWWIILVAFIFWVPLLRLWWWLLVPIVLAIELVRLYDWWIHWDFWYPSIKWVVLEIIPPKEVLTPLKAMEDVYTVIWPTLFDGPNWREQNCEGALADAPDWMSWEIAYVDGKVHFYMRVNAAHRAAIESSLYAHYPDLEIQEVPDYTKNVPQNMPNEEWDVYGEDFRLAREAAYPIRTYEKFFEPQGEKISAEEKRIDPLVSLLEAMSKLGPGEQFWLQFIISGVTEKNEPHYLAGADKIIAKLSKRPEKKKPKTLLEEIWDVIYKLVVGPTAEGTGENIKYKWLESAKSETGEREMLLTPGEREIMTEVENKIKKPIFRTVMRGVYVAKRENFKKAHRLLTRSYFAHFATQNLNQIIFSIATRPKTHYFFRKRIPFIRSRRMLRNYVLRFTPHFPDRRRDTAVLNTEELATLFHFPVKVSGMAMPTMPHVESKKVGPPSNLPFE